MKRNVCVLYSGGLDSSVLLGLESITATVWPLRVHYGLRWEISEEVMCRKYIRALRRRGPRTVQQLAVKEIDVAPAARPSWALGGSVPPAGSEDTAVELPDRNTLLLRTALEFCAGHGIPEMALGILAGNPFADATEGFFARWEEASVIRFGRRVRIRTPFRTLRKSDVIHFGKADRLPLDLTVSCCDPIDEGIHCGECNKCAERQEAFRQARVRDGAKFASL